MKSKYTSPKSVAKNPTLPIDQEDPRLSKQSEGATRARSGSEIVVINPRSEVTLAGSYRAQTNASAAGPATPETSRPGLADEITTEVGPISGLVLTRDGEDILFEFDFNPNVYANRFATEFRVILTRGSVTRVTAVGLFPINKSLTRHQYRLTQLMILQTMGYNEVDFDQFCVYAFDAFSTEGGTPICATIIPPYVLNLAAPEITVVAANNGYVITVTNVSEMAKSAFANIDIWEIESNDATAPAILYAPDGITPTNYKRVYLSTINPATIISPNLNKRWVIARFTSKFFDRYSNFSIAYAVTPISPVNVDLTPPNEVTIDSSVWSGDNIVINYTLPSTDAGTRFIISMTPPGTNPPTGYFYFTTDGTGNLNQTATITKADLFAQFGEYYSSFSGVFKSVDSADNKSPGVSFNVPTRVNPLAGIVPTFTIVDIVNGYTLTFDKPVAASYAEVYRKYTSWSGDDSDIDYFTATAASSNSDEINLSDLIDNEGNEVTHIPTGYLVTGTGVPPGTWVIDVNQGQKKITVNNIVNISSGTVLTIGALVYSGPSPAVIQDTTYADVYIKIRYYDSWHNSSEYSLEQTARAISPIGADTTPPPTPASVSATSAIDESGTLGFNGYIDVSWTRVTDSTVRGYRIRYTTDTVDPVYSYVDSPGNTSTSPEFRITGLAVGAAYDIAVASYDEYNNVSTYTSVISPVLIDGIPSMANYIIAGNQGFKFGSGIDPSETKSGIYLSSSNYWYIDGSGATFNVGGDTTNYLNWNGSKLELDGDITARGGSFSGNIELSTIGASIFNGDVTTVPDTLTGDGFILNKDGLFARKSTATAQLTIDGGLVTDYGSIANWKITTNKLENQLSGISDKYVGLSSDTAASYAIWAGANAPGNLNGEAKFSVTPAGAVQASNITISGGSLNINNVFKVSTAGVLEATGAIINGQITATSGSFAGNVFIGTSGSIYSGTVVPGTPPTLTGQGFILNRNGLRFNSDTIPGITTIDGTTGLFITQSAQIGGWNVNSSQITKSGTYGTVTLDSTLAAIILSATTGANAGIGAATANSSQVFWAGVGKDNANNNFSVTASGKLTAIDAEIKGTLRGGNKTGLTSTENGYFFTNDGQMNIGSSNSFIKLSDGNIEIQTGAIGRVELNVGSNTNATVGLFVSGLTRDNEDFSKNDPALVAVVRDNTGAAGPYKVTRGRRFYWGFNYTPSGAIGNVVDIEYAQAGDIFFSMAE